MGRSLPLFTAAEGDGACRGAASNKQHETRRKVDGQDERVDEPIAGTKKKWDEGRRMDVREKPKGWKNNRVDGAWIKFW